MRRTLTISRTGLAGVAAVVLLTACGGTSSSSASSSSSAASPTTSSSSSAAGGSASNSQFCQQAASFTTELDSIGNIEDPSQFGSVLQQAAAKIGAIQPPQEIASDWSSLVNALNQLAQAASATNFNDPEQAAAFAQTAGQLESRLSSSSTTVSNYLQNQCGINVNGTGSSAPTG